MTILVYQINMLHWTVRRLKNSYNPGRFRIIGISVADWQHYADVALGSNKKRTYSYKTSKWHVRDPSRSEMSALSTGHSETQTFRRSVNCFVYWSTSPFVGDALIGVARNLSWGHSAGFVKFFVEVDLRRERCRCGWGDETGCPPSPWGRIRIFFSFWSQNGEFWYILTR